MPERSTNTVQPGRRVKPMLVCITPALQAALDREVARQGVVSRSHVIRTAIKNYLQIAEAARL